ncbi:MAG: hypothetical protein DKT66_14075 [Candidatus Melainabacteria bacterium]|nr:MAG: hypothetical protein DKT66_14075 [Candidatus Melainabacteria bacterium]
MTGEAPCKLCYVIKPLCDSHVVPNFAAKIIKKDSPTGYFRMAGEPNVPKQSFPSFKMLCKDCEDKFGRLEHTFRNVIYVPYLERPNLPTEEQKRALFVKYGSWFRDYALSLAWRTAICHLDFKDLDTEKPYVADVVRKAASQWRSYLKGASIHPGKSQSRIWLIDLSMAEAIKDCGAAQHNWKLSSGFFAYLLRGCDFTVVYTTSESEIGVFTKLPGAIFWTTIIPSRIENESGFDIREKGTIDLLKHSFDNKLLEFLNSRVEEGMKLLDSGMSSVQREKMNERIKKAIGATPEKFEQAIDIRLKDLQLSLDDVTQVHEESPSVE